MRKDNPFLLPSRLIRKYGTRDPFKIAEAMGIIVVFRDDYVKQKGAFAVVLGNRFIFINDNLSWPMKVIVCAHELGHALRHWRLCKRMAIYEMTLFDMKNPLEREANMFAAGLLIDENRMMECLKRGYTLEQTANELDTITELVVILARAMQDQMECPENLPEFPASGFLAAINDSNCW